MNELVTITQNEINGFKQATINARELWLFIESKQEFTNWIKSRIEKYGFQEGVDFNLDKIIKVQIEGGREVNREMTDYICTLDMGKELAMVENNDRGRQVRRYFIEVEKKAKEGYFSSARRLPQTYEESLEDLLHEVRKNKVLTAQVTRLLPDAEYAKEVQDSESLLTLTLIAKSMGLGPIKLNQFLVERDVLRSDNHLPTHKYQARTELFKVVTFTQIIEGITKTRHLLKWTEKGRRFVFELWQSYKNIKKTDLCLIAQ